jgi:hypothetical protein
MSEAIARDFISASATAFGSPPLAGVQVDSARAATLGELTGAGDAVFFAEETGVSVVLSIAMAVAGEEELASGSGASCFTFAGVHLEKKDEMDFCCGGIACVFFFIDATAAEGAKELPHRGGKDVDTGLVSVQKSSDRDPARQSLPLVWMLTRVLSQ